ncbi:MAG: hypothetical protein BWZ02_02301 [Lentisphaerae bacterium ADurb.BinA184]|nr:MAG: hypothetical protein BWZ02_02301 [Lentisphaerae bacterium ADurb.BinA184]
MKRERLTGFVAWAHSHITGDEKSQAHIFLDRLFQAFGQPGCLDVGGSPEVRVRKAAEDGGGIAFADYVWKPVVLVEMKRRGADLQKYYRQAFDYWVRLVPDRPRYVVLCNFDEFRVYDFETQMDAPVDTLALSDLPDRFGALAFLAPGNPEPTFGNDRVAVTRQAADQLAACFRHLVGRGVERELAQRFVLQVLVALFSEDIGLLDKYLVARLLADCAKAEDSFDLLGGLFAAMNSARPVTGGRYRGVPYFNGGLFAESAAIELDIVELNLLRQAAASDWSKVQPEIFGALFQDSLDAGERHALGAHFTHPADIMKIVGPTIVEPWREQIEGAKTLRRLRELRDRLHSFRVLDPACGSGNFLYIAYRELKRLEARLFERMDEFKSEAQPGQGRLSFLSAQNFYGLDILPFAVETAKVTMMIARKLAIDEMRITEKALPLDNLDANFVACDALLMPGGVPTPWPKADVIIGNPPFLGAKRLKPERGPDYVNGLREAYPEVPGMADYCVYWLRRAAEHLPPCTAADPVAGRAGLVGTQNIRNNQSRVGGLDRIVKDGTIVEAVENQPWSGDANVHVSIVNWVRTQDPVLLPKARKLWYKVESAKSAKRKRGEGPASKQYELDFRTCPHINSALSDRTDVSTAIRLGVNCHPQRAFQGVTPGYDAFVLSPGEASALIRQDGRAVDFIRPYLIGRELASGDGTPRRYLVDAFGRSILDLAQSPPIEKHLRFHVLPSVQAKVHEVAGGNSDMVRPREEHLARWWTFWAQRTELRTWMKGYRRILAGSRTQRRPFVFTFISTSILPGDKLQLFALEDDYSFGVLQSVAHAAWYERRASRLKNEEDYNYSSDAVFDTFPWPQLGGGGSAGDTGAGTDGGGAVAGRLAPAAIAKIEAVAAAGCEVRRIRAEALPNMKGGLRALYRTLELPGKNPLKDAHAALDAAVLEAYGFDPKADLLAQLLALNLEVAARLERGEPVTAPGLPPGFPDPARLVTSDCIQPPGLDGALPAKA